MFVLCICLFVCFFYQCFHFAVQLRCYRCLYVCGFVFLWGVLCGISKLYIKDFNGVFNCIAFTASTKIFNNQILHPAIYHQIKPSPSTNSPSAIDIMGYWAGRQAVRFCEILISVHDAILFYCKYHFHLFISKLIIGTICKDFCFAKWQKI